MSMVSEHYIFVIASPLILEACHSDKAAFSIKIELWSFSFIAKARGANITPVSSEKLECEDLIQNCASD